VRDADPADGAWSTSVGLHPTGDALCYLDLQSDRVSDPFLRRVVPSECLLAQTESIRHTGPKYHYSGIVAGLISRRMAEAWF
jgi:hypothetical protein